MAVHRLCALLLVLALLYSSVAAQRPADVQRALSLSDLRERVERLTSILLATPPDSSAYSALLFRAEAYSRLQLHDLARRDLDRARPLRPTEPAAILPTIESVVAFNGGDARAAFDAAERAIALLPTYRDPILLRAQAGVKLMRYAEAQRDAQVILAAEPAHLTALLTLAQAQEGLKQPDAALTTLDRALALHPNDAALLEQKLLLLDRLGRTAEVEQLAGDVTRFAPNDPLSLSNLGAVFHNAGQYARALDYHSRGIALYQEKMKDPAFARSRADQLYTITLNRGSTYRMLAEPDRALADFVRASRLLPQRYEAWYYIGELQVAQRNYREAIDAYEACFIRHPTLTVGWVNLTFAYMNLGRRSEALGAFDRAMRVPNVAQRALLLNNRGFCRLELGQAAPARADLEAAVATDPRVGMPHISLGEYFLAQGDSARAQQQFDYAERLPFLDARERWTLHYQRGRVHLTAQRPTQAVADFRQAIAADVSFAEAHEQLGRALMQLGQWCPARQALRSALDRPERMYPDQKSEAALLLTRLDLEHPQPCQ